MERRLVEFVAALRASGVRVSLAESVDCFRAVEGLGVREREPFRTALRATLVKESADLPTFDHLFPLFFGTGQPPTLRPEEMLGEEGRRRLEQALRALAGRLGELLRKFLSGKGLRREELEALGREAGLSRMRRLDQQRWAEQRMKRALGWQELLEALEHLLQGLAEGGMGREDLERLQELAGMNLQALEEQLRHFAGGSIARRAAEEYRPQEGPELPHIPFRRLTEREAEALRDEVHRLAARLRSRAALRHRRGKRGHLDPKATLRTNLRYGGVPMELRLRRRHLKPKLVLLCDVSTSVRHCAEFLLRLIYELQDQVARARSFAFIDHLEEISDEFNEHRPAVAVASVLRRLPPGYYSTDLGASLATFCHEYLDAVDRRTAFLILGDGRNNFNDPRLDCLETIGRRARRVLWFNPEPHPLWGTGDSDMPLYLPLCESVHQVSNLAELAQAVDRLFVGR